MSTSDQPESTPLTRKQLREIRLTGATPIISADEAAEQASAPTPVSAKAAEPAEVAPSPADDDVDLGASPLTRRQAREQERIRTASVPVITPEGTPVVQDDAQPEVVSEVPSFVVEKQIVEEQAVEEPVEAEPADDAVPAVEDTRIVAEEQEPLAKGPGADEQGEEEERPVVRPSFGESVLGDPSDAVPTFSPSFDDLITSDSTGSQHIAPNTLIFTPSPGDGSLSGPVASTGELLVTGSYDLPDGLGSQGHARGTTDGKDIDAVLIDGELPPASSPTPIAASSAVSTIKPAGEVIRPPAPEKGNKLMFTLAITAGGLALALAVALIVAFATNVF